MKTAGLVLTLLLAFVFTLHSPEAAAKRLGGGKSFGQSFRTAPAAPMAAPMAPRSQPDFGANPAQPRRGLFGGGMMGGLLGGMLAGSLLGALFSGGGFQGIQFLDLLVMGAIGFVLFRMLRSRAPAGAPALSPTSFRDIGPAAGAPGRRVFDVPHIGHGANDAATPPVGRTATGFGESDVPFNFPPGFNQNSFLLGAREHYREVQAAWNRNDFNKLGEYLAPALVEELRAERNTLEGDQHTEVLFVDAEIVRADVQGPRAELSVKFSGSWRDKVENVEEPFVDIWHLARDTSDGSAPWLIIGIESR